VLAPCVTLKGTESKYAARGRIGTALKRSVAGDHLSDIWNCLNVADRLFAWWLSVEIGSVIRRC